MSCFVGHPVAESKFQDAKIKDKLFCDRQILNRICLKTVSTCMTEHPDIFKKADHGELHTYSLHRETALLYTVLHILPRRRTWIQKSQKLEKSLTNFLPTAISLLMVIIILFNRFMKPCKLYSGKQTKNQKEWSFYLLWDNIWELLNQQNKLKPSSQISDLNLNCNCVNFLDLFEKDCI